MQFAEVVEVGRVRPRVVLVMTETAPGLLALCSQGVAHWVSPFFIGLYVGRWFVLITALVPIGLATTLSLAGYVDKE